MTEIQFTVAAMEDANGKPHIVVGFHSGVFSQAVYLPYQDYSKMVKTADDFSDAIKGAASEILSKTIAVE